MKTIRFMASTCAISIFILAACARSITQTPTITSGLIADTPKLPDRTETIEPTRAIVSGPVPTRTMTTKPSVSPTVVAALPQSIASATMYDLLLNNGGCKFPCWWALTPGISKPGEVYDRLASLQSFADGDYLDQSQGMIGYVYPYQDVENHITISYYPDQKTGMIGVIYLGSQALQKVGDASWLPLYEAPAYQELFRNYTIPEILKTYGKPSLIWLGANVWPEGHVNPSTARITLLYPDQGIFLRYTGIAERSGKQIRFCPLKTFIEIWLLPPDAGKSYQDFLNAYPVDWEGTPRKIGVMDLVDATDMTIDQFVAIYDQPSQTCIETDISLWPAP